MPASRKAAKRGSSSSHTVEIRADSSQAVAALKALKAEADGVAAALDNRPTKLRHIRKALTALVAGLLGWVSTCYVPDGHIDRAEWYALAVVIAGVAGVFAVPNAPKISTEPITEEGDAGHVDVLTAVVVVLVVIVILILVGVLPN